MSPVVAAGEDNSPLIAGLLVIPIVILFVCIWLLVDCSERWSRSNNRLTRFLCRRGREDSDVEAPNCRSGDSTLVGSSTSENQNSKV